MKKKSQRIASIAPGFSSFLHSICVGKKVASEAGANDDETSVELDQLLEIKKTTIANIILNARNRKCNAFQVAVGVYLHSTNTPDKVISTLHHAGLCVSQASISRAIRSLSTEALVSLSTLGKDLLIAYAYDNFDILLKASTPTVETNTDPLKHLTSGLVFPSNTMFGLRTCSSLILVIKENDKFLVMSL
ncbi:hypothetical protein BDM02DRAFT_2331913 [Thelephora ganbajun]|uniref:Uncharacterized protein n=1 Tax=Thelephora ganbajun TaxID=370292 RepID=A0ACB6ZEP6_THEGA|nr:hypothetical protein BDM02DRAFT_2331913 [Thelephora ganbajun]